MLTTAAEHSNGAYAVNRIHRVVQCGVSIMCTRNPPPPSTAGLTPFVGGESNRPANDDDDDGYMPSR